MKKEITIKIPHGLSEKDEIIQIVNKLRQNLLSGSGKNKETKRIGDQPVEVLQLETNIKVVRELKEKVIHTQTCNCCGVVFQSNEGVKLFHNYGGFKKILLVCSKDCGEKIVSEFGGRISFRNQNIQTVRFW